MRCYHAGVSEKRAGLLQRFFDFYAVSIGVTPPPPEKQKWVLIILIAFFVGLVALLVVVANVVSQI